MTTFKKPATNSLLKEVAGPTSDISYTTLGETSHAEGVPESVKPTPRLGWEIRAQSDGRHDEGDHCWAAEKALSRQGAVPGARGRCANGPGHPLLLPFSRWAPRTLAAQAGLLPPV